MKFLSNFWNMCLHLFVYWGRFIKYLKEEARSQAKIKCEKA